MWAWGDPEREETVLLVTVTSRDETARRCPALGCGWPLGERHLSHRHPGLLLGAQGTPRTRPPCCHRVLPGTQGHVWAPGCHGRMAAPSPCPWGTSVEPRRWGRTCKPSHMVVLGHSGPRQPAAEGIPGTAQVTWPPFGAVSELSEGLPPAPWTLRTNSHIAPKTPSSACQSFPAPSKKSLAPHSADDPPSSTHPPQTSPNQPYLQWCPPTPNICTLVQIRHPESTAAGSLQVETLSGSCDGSPGQCGDHGQATRSEGAGGAGQREGPLWRSAGGLLSSQERGCSLGSPEPGPRAVSGHSRDRGEDRGQGAGKNGGHPAALARTVTGGCLGGGDRAQTRQASL